ncbi:galactokinase [Zongyangia hominis]|uniref:Galactokinase n=1 Tax=Zongyangia hominis TaxID=2763677 RepID=A0A926EE88_9FIRM|nr:galactokinase family protein [Zongyangia hominis]MBC8570132.1 galactokinase [Zongyangia hominis]
MPSFYKVKDQLQKGKYASQFARLYAPDAVGKQVQRYLAALDRFASLFGDNGEVYLFSAPGRTEIGGNHTDHQCGRVLAAAVNLDMIAVVSPNMSRTVRIKSHGFNMDVIDIDQLEFQQIESGTSASIVRGILARCKELGYQIGGFDAYTISDVIKGSGLSSSAAFEVMVGTIVSELYNGGRIPPVEVAKIGQYAENTYFKKPCGLMDQIACALGGFVVIDFEDMQNPKIQRIQCDFSRYEHDLFIVDTGGSHANLTTEYASVAREMWAVAHVFGKKVLREIKPEDFVNSLYDDRINLRRKVSDRAILRAMHFFDENERVLDEVKALQNGDFERFKELVIASGRSSSMLLQNIYVSREPERQGLSLGLAITEQVLRGRGAWRVHGGGFAGTMQALVPYDLSKHYKVTMQQAMGTGSCHVLSVRKEGAIRLSLPEEEGIHT